jgi:ABC-2 type transport system permease protein
MNDKIMAVVRREFVSRVHTRTFIITTLLLPVVILAIAVIPGLLMGQSDQTTRIALIDGTSAHLGQRVGQVLDAEKLDSDKDAKPRYRVTVMPANGHGDTVRKRLIAQTGFSRDAADGKYDGVLVLDDGVLKSGKLTYYGGNVSSPDAMTHLRGSLSKAFAAMRLANAGINVATVSQAMRPLDVHGERVSDGKLTGQSGHGAFMVAYGMGFLLYMAIVLFGQRTMTSVIEEKTSRVMEVLVSSLTPFEMLAGKVLGVGAAGLLQMAIWGVSAWLITSHTAQLAALVGANANTFSAFALPSISGALVGVFLVYFALGFLLYGALFAAIGAMCNSTQDTQQYASVVTMVILIGFLAMFGIISNPTGQLAHVAPWIPFLAPFTMPVAWSLTSVSVVNLIGSLALMALAIWACVWVAARIYRIGILMFGKKPSWREVWRWVLAS